MARGRLDTSAGVSEALGFSMISGAGLPFGVSIIAATVVAPGCFLASATLVVTGCFLTSTSALAGGGCLTSGVLQAGGNSVVSDAISATGVTVTLGGSLVVDVSIRGSVPLMGMFIFVRHFSSDSTAETCTLTSGLGRVSIIDGEQSDAADAEAVLLLAIEVDVTSSAGEARLELRVDAFDIEEGLESLCILR